MLTLNDLLSSIESHIDLYYEEPKSQATEPEGEVSKRESDCGYDWDECPHPFRDCDRCSENGGWKDEDTTEEKKEGD